MANQVPSGKRVFVVGVGMSPFLKPGSTANDYPDLGKLAGERALADACVDYSEMQQVVCSYVYGDSTCGQRVAYELGCTGVPVYNVNNNCASGASALHLGYTFVRGGQSDCVLCLGFEKMERGSLGIKFHDRSNPMEKHLMSMLEINDEIGTAPGAAWMFGSAGREHMRQYGTTADQILKIAHKNHKHSVNNPYSQFRDEYSLDQIRDAKMVFEPLTKLACCPTSDGAAAVVLASEEFVRAHGLEGQAVEIVGMAMRTDYDSTFDSGSSIKSVGSEMTRTAAESALAQAGVGAGDIDVVELHDCFAANELITYEALGLCGEGEAGRCVDAGDFTYGGARCVVNPSGGLISKGHPLGATGLAQCTEMCWQLRGEAAARQVPGAELALSHNLGLGGAAVVTVYKRPDAWKGLAPRRAVSGGGGFAEDGTGGAAPAPVAGMVRSRL